MHLDNPKKFENYALVKVSDDEFQKKPLFAENGKKVIVSNRNEFHIYSTHSGDRLNVFTCSGLITDLQADPDDQNNILIFTDLGNVYNFKGVEKPKPRLVCQMKINGDFIKPTDGSKSKATEDNAQGKNKNKTRFITSCVVSKKIYALWSTPKDKKAQLSVFELDTGNQIKNDTFANISCDKKWGSLTAGNNFIILLSSYALFVYNLVQDNFRWHKANDSVRFTCVSAHPEEPVFATGDAHGKITVWRNIFDKIPLLDVYHWHTLPVTCLTFSECGSHIFSGGEENVLVKWSLAARTKNFLPRLSSTIHNISISRGNDVVSVSTSDGQILIINLNFSKLATIQHFSRWTGDPNTHPSHILLQDPRTGSLVLTGRTGHLQFISTQELGRFLSVLDVTQRNYITRERSGWGVRKTVDNMEIKFASFSKCGKWLATVEADSRETGLKFWMFDTKLQEFSLNTYVDAPHGSSAVQCLEVGSSELAVTTGDDGYYRIWSLVETSHLHQTRITWHQMGSGEHRRLPCGPAHLSLDSSLLAVGFGPALTLWDTEQCQLKASLTAPLQRSAVKFIRFGNGQMSHLAVAGTEGDMSCWNLVTLCRQWVVPLRLELLVSDVNSSLMCAVSDKSIFIFYPSNPQPELKVKAKNKKIKSAIFVASSSEPSLYFLTQDQQVYSLANEKRQVQLSQTPTHLTPFSAQLPKSERKDILASKKGVNVALPQKFSAAILDGPSHALPPVSLLCEDLLSSLLVKVNISQTTVVPDNEEIVELQTADRTLQTRSISDSELENNVKQIFNSKYESGLR